MLSFESFSDEVLSLVFLLAQPGDVYALAGKTVAQLHRAHLGAHLAAAAFVSRRIHE